MSSNHPHGFVLNTKKGYFQHFGVDVMAFDDIYPEGHQSGVSILMHGSRVATNGDIRFEPTPGQWQPVPKQESRTLDGDANTITTRLGYPDMNRHLRGFNPMIYPDFEFGYTVTVKGEGASVRVTVDLDRPVPAEYEGKLGFNLELFPADLFGQLWMMDGKQGLFPRQPNGPVMEQASNYEKTASLKPLDGSHTSRERLSGDHTSYNPIIADDLIAAPYAVGRRFTVRPDDPLHRFTIETATADLELYDGRIHREMAMLTEDIIEAGGGSMGISHHQSQLVHFMKKLNNAERAEKVASDSVKMEACREMLLPSSLTGREQIDARRDLIFKCTDAIINTVYDLYAENAADLTEEEWNSLTSVENVVATVYGQNFNDHFVLVRGLYKGVQGALKRGKIEEAVQRLQVIVERLKLQETESAHINPLILEEQVDRLYLSHLTIFSISMEAMWLVENITKDFSYEGAPAFKKEYPQFDEVCKELSRMMDSDGGQTEKDANNILIRMWRKAHPDADQE